MHSQLQGGLRTVFTLTLETMLTWQELAATWQEGATSGNADKYYRQIFYPVLGLLGLALLAIIATLALIMRDLKVAAKYL